MFKHKIGSSVELDNKVFFKNRSRLYTRSCLTFLRSFYSNRLPNQMSEDTLNANTSYGTATLFDTLTFATI